MIVIDDMIDNDILLVLEVDIEDRSRSVEVEVEEWKEEWKEEGMNCA